MLITPKYCRLVARYNIWQNAGLRGTVEALPLAKLDRERGAFFGSVRAMLDHLLWGDQMWLSRFCGTSAPNGAISDSVTLTPAVAVWEAERFATDGRTRIWAAGLRAVHLTGDLTWYCGAAGREIRKPVQPLIVHFFNHQTHHRGQIDAVLTAAGLAPGDTDLFLLPET